MDEKAILDNIYVFLDRIEYKGHDECDARKCKKYSVLMNQ